MLLVIRYVGQLSNMCPFIGRRLIIEDLSRSPPILMLSPASALFMIVMLLTHGIGLNGQNFDE
ncbi:MAG: hypothetical protein A4E19_05465 [Nitrospira sp. SG-bin1]|nr:MAG: hypothetical protein A4E19_05465 [Nitrospira sp. SG-bin1]